MTRIFLHQPEPRPNSEASDTFQKQISSTDPDLASTLQEPSLPTEQDDNDKANDQAERVARMNGQQDDNDKDPYRQLQRATEKMVDRIVDNVINLIEKFEAVMEGHNSKNSSKGAQVVAFEEICSDQKSVEYESSEGTLTPTASSTGEQLDKEAEAWAFSSAETMKVFARELLEAKKDHEAKVESEGISGGEEKRSGASFFDSLKTSVRAFFNKVASTFRYVKESVSSFVKGTWTVLSDSWENFKSIIQSAAQDLTAKFGSRRKFKTC
ncbi:hypothetical protein ABW21_db0208079 [Orbilia brochopaga]|nr:hypothetical protein ABW21_db0208079 [Drechslerella brochopaga]